ncbi:HNH endonuclease signature motif containing protein [Corynebacterium guaraldiae]|uniref:HNH endonuclease signature motif containing protein n=1 Tax=Corynebacterium guaraldiae TaxID=3051103 RepID=UPI0012B9316A|nr:HNH endonuclease signature motif containing protein [Corynebacterium guaraldiae]MTD97323.1 HNH endonuclease [Corynebacterium guaraldiae]
MNLVEAHLRSQAAGIELVAGVAGFSFEQLRAWGPESAARSLLALFDVYFASTAFTRKQARAVAAARANGHDLPTLLLIERFAGRLKKQRQAWDLRIELCGITGDEKAVARYARKRIRELSPPPTPKPGVTIRRGKELSKLTLTAPAALIEDLRPNFDEDDPVGSFTAAFREGRLARPVAQTLAVMELPEYATILGRLGDPSTPRPDSADPASAAPIPPNSTSDQPTISSCADESQDNAAPDLGDIVIQLSNGAKITGQELIERELAEEGLVMIVDRVKGPVELHHTQRVASEKQRIMACGEQPTCAWDRCLCGADYSQIHHITEWRHGGETNPENLTPLCKYHNAINGLPGRGRIVRENGKIKWVPAGPRDPREPAHPHRAPRAQRIREHRDGTASQSCTEPSARTPAAPPASTPSEPGSPAPPDR